MFGRPKAGFHYQQSCSPSLNQKCRAIRCRENQTDRVESRTLILLRTLSLTIKGKLHCWSHKQKQKNKPMTMFDSRPWDWLVLPLPTPTTYFSLDHKRRSRKRNRKKWKRSDSSDSDSVELMTLLTTPIFDFH